MKVLAFNIMASKSVLYQFRGSKLQVILFWCFHTMVSKSLSCKRLQSTRLMNKLGTMKEIQWAHPWKDSRLLSLSLLNFPSFRFRYFYLRTSRNNNLSCRETETSLANEHFLQFDMLLWCHFQSYVNIEVECTLMINKCAPTALSLSFQ